MTRRSGPVRRYVTVPNAITVVRTAVAMGLAVAALMSASAALTVTAFLIYWTGDVLDGLVFLSATLGLPPLLLVSVYAAQTPIPSSARLVRTSRDRRPWPPARPLGHGHR